MSRRVVVFGNSHLGAFKRGWRVIKHEFAGDSIDFYGAPGSTIRDVTVSKGIVSAQGNKTLEMFRRTGGSDRFALADYDFIVIVGCRLSVMTLLGLLKLYLPPLLNSGASLDKALRDRDPFGAGRSRILVSSGLMSEIMNAQVRQTIACRLVDSIASQSSIPIYYVPDPLPSSELLSLKPKSAIPKLINMGLGETMASIYWSTLEAAMRGKATIVRAPEEIVVDHLLTQSQYCSGSFRLEEDRGAHHEEDLKHMNGDYGALLMRQIFAKANGRV
jgi:hypothetical protein